MADSKIVITASLNTVETVETIKKDLKTVEGMLESNPLQISCSISDSSIKRMQTQLDSLTKGLIINAGINAQNIQQSINNAIGTNGVKVNVSTEVDKKVINKDVDYIKKMFQLGIKGNTLTEFRQQLKPLLQEFSDAYKSLDTERVEKSFEKILDFVEKTKNETFVLDEALKQAQKTLREALGQDGKLYIDSRTYGDLQAMYGDQTKQVLKTVFGQFDISESGKTSLESWDVLANHLKEVKIEANSLAEGIAGIYEQLSRTVPKGNVFDVTENYQQIFDALSGALKLPPDVYELMGSEVWSGAKYNDFAQVINNADASMQNLTNDTRQAETVVDELFASFGSSNAYSEGLREIARLKSEISAQAGVNSVTSEWTYDQNRNIDGFVLQIKKIGGVVDNLKYKFNEAKQAYEDIGGKASDKGAVKLQQDIARLQKELANFEASHKSIESGLTEPLEVARKALTDLKNNVGSVETVQKALDNLKTVAANIASNLKATASSFNVFDNAVNKAQNFDNIIKTLGIDISKLTSTDSKNGLVEQLELATMRLEDFKRVEAEQGRGLEWSSRYAEISSLIQSIANNLKVAQKEDAVLTKELEQQQNLREKIVTEQQHNYWQGRFEESIKAMTAENTVLKEMRQYYADMAKEAQQKENAFNREFERELKAEEKLEAEEQKRLATARELRDEQQHNYWQGRFEESLKAMTAENTTLKEMRQYYEELNKAAQKFSDAQGKEVNKYLKQANDTIKDNLKVLEEFNNSSLAKNNVSNRAVSSQLGLNSDLINQLRGLQESLSADKSGDNVARVTGRLQELSATLETARWNTEYLNDALKNQEAEAKFQAKLNVLTNQMEIFANANRKATDSLREMRNGETFSSTWQTMLQQLNDPNLDAAGLQRLREQFQNFRGEADAAGLTVSRFFQSMKSQLRMVLQRWISLYAVIGYIRKMVDSVKELDNAMIDLRRVTDETDGAYQNFLENANELARAMKTTTSSLVEQSYQWAKLGYSMQEALELAQSSTIFMKVADVNQDQALSNLVTILKAYNIESKNTIEIVDKLDKLNNRYAVSASGLGEGLERSASAMAMTGNSLDETLALLTGAGEIVQNLDNTGNAIRVISLRLQNMKGKLEELDEPVDDLMEVSKVQTQILNLTGNQVDIIDQQTGGFKSTYKILEEISKVWDSLNDQRRSALLEILAGKNRANIGAALIQAFQSGQIQQALEDAGDAAGTATEEYSRMMSGIQAQFDEFKGALEELSNEFIKSNFIKDIVNGGTALIRLLTTLTEKFGTLAVILTPILTFVGAKYSLNFFSAIYNGIRNIILAMNGMTAATGAAADAFLSLKGAVTGFAVGAAIALISLGVRELTTSAREAKEAADELRSESKANAEEYRQEEEALDDVASKYIEAISSTQTYAEKKQELLDIQNQLPDTYKDEANGIDLVNGKIEENIKLLDEQKKKRAEEYVQSNQGGYEQALQELGQGKNVLIGTKRYANEIEEFVERNLNRISGKLVTDSLGNYFVEGTLEERISTLEEIRRLYAQEKGHKTEVLSQLDTEISDYKTILKTNQDIVSEMDKQKGIISISEQEYNMIDQAIIAYSEYQKALNEDDNIGMSNALKTLESVRDTVYSVTDSGSALRTEFDEVWDSFKFGGGEVLEGIREVQEKFTEITDKAFGEELGNIDAIDKAIESLLEGKNLSHDDAWKLLNLDTEGTLKDIRVINGEYKLSTEELARLADQRIQKRKESIAAIKAEAEAQLAANEAKLAGLKINSLSDAKYYAATIQSINEDIKTARDIIKQSGLLLGELNGRLVKTEMLTSQTSTQLNSAIEAFENEIEAIEDSVDALNDRKDALNDEKEALQEELDLLNEQKEAIEQTLKNYDAVADAVNSYVEAQKDGIQERIDALEEEQKSIEDYYNSQIDALKEQNEERDDAIKKEKALADLANAENQKKRIYSSARGWEYLSSKEDIVNAQNALAEIENDQKIKKLEKERDAKLGGFDERKKEYETQIKAFDEYAKKYSNIASDIQEAENALLADQILGSDWRVKIEETDEGLLQKYRSEYQSFNNQLKTLVNTEITNLQASIDMKDKEIKKIDKEIEAYNKYKTTVQKNLKDAQDALETYKNSVNNAKNDVIGDMATMETETWYKTSDCKRWWNELADTVDEAKRRMTDACWEVGNSAKDLANTLQGHLLSGDISLAQYVRMMKLGSFADGGVNNYTGLAMLHGTAQNPETIFNAKDSAKLYELVHNTPNIMASMVSRASQLIPNLTNTNNNMANSISVNIGQVVANNPMELTRNLDTHLDSYFRRKLTQGYVQ